jgi:hypothetical protein
VPKKVLPDEASFQAFERALVVKRGFRKITRTEFKKDFERLALEAPSPRKGREAGFAFTANGLTVIVWTTFVETEGAARETDAGWVLIKEKDNPLYFARPMNRTKNFLYRLLEQACIARERVLNRPLCPACNAFMRITQGRGLKSRYWSCKSPLHKKMERRSWDDGLRPEVLERVKKVRKSRAPYTDKLKAVGKASGIAMLRRKGWTVGKPGNMIP